jgi:hypothetical protein
MPEPVTVAHGKVIRTVPVDVNVIRIPVRFQACFKKPLRKHL